MTQRISLSDFWARYGRQDYDQTDFACALARLPALSVDGPWVAGGSVRRLISRLPQESDFDFFFRDQEQFDAFCAAMKERGSKVTAESDFNVTFRLPAAEAKSTGDDEFSPGGPELKVQAIRVAYHASVEAVVESFDFSICQCGYDGADLTFGQWALFDIASKRLVPGRISYGVSSVRRVIKYARQGFTICGGGLAAMLEQIAADPTIIQSDVEYVD